MSVCASVLSLYVCMCVCLCTRKLKNNGSIHLKLEHIVVYENSSDGRVRHWALSDQGQGHSVTLKFFSIYHNTNCQGLYLSYGK